MSLTRSASGLGETRHERAAMPSRSSSCTRSTQSTQQAAFPTCFPTARALAPEADLKTLPQRPRWKDPILDPASCSIPIRQFDEQSHSCFYAKRQAGVEADLPSAQPEHFADNYLMPSLTHNERLRLTMLWYHTNGLLDDQEFLLRLQAIVGLVQTFFQDWEFAIMGLVYEDAFARIATAGIPLAVVPRRESPCSHTLTQEPGNVFFLPDMGNDWRFAAAPTVAQGLRGYAGAQLRCDTPGGETVALGSLCIASNSRQPTFTLAQQNALIRFADMLSAELVSHSREARKRQRHFMAQLLAECRLDELEDAEKRILDVVRRVYPAASVDFIEPRDDQITLPAHAPIDLSDIDEGLWEDAEFIEELIRTNNHKTLKTSRTVRAIIHPVQTYPVVRFLVVASSQIQTVFDDVDTWFVQNCAMSLGKVIHERMFGEALMVKEKFLRGITHQLRTPIHGVLASCELLTEELSNRKLLGHDPVFTSILDAIRDSGNELMNTVNNMLKLNRWAETIVNRKPICVQDWTQFEDEILSEVDQTIPDHERTDVAIFFNNNVSDQDSSTISVDITLLKECIQSLVLNALQSTKKGAIIVAINAAPDRSYLEVDVIDTGHGIAAADQERIFEAYEKVDIHSRGAGLGLTLATNIAKLMHGNVILISSSQSSGHQRGSHFRATVATSSPTNPAPSLHGFLPDVPRIDKPLTFHLVNHHEAGSDLCLNFTRFLERRGFNRVHSGHNSIALLPFLSDPDALNRLIAKNPAKMAVCLAPAGATLMNACQRDSVRIFRGPFTSLRLKYILVDIQRTWESLQRTDTPTEAATLRRIRAASGAIVTQGLEAPPPSAEMTPFALLVDDNMVNLKIMRMYCEKRGIEHTTAINGREAVNRFRASLAKGRPLNLILMDLQMPVCDGADATAEIRAIEREEAAGPSDASDCSLVVVEPSRAPSRIFMVTGQDSLSDKARSFAAGADEFYVKPMGMKKLDLGIGKYFPRFGRAVLSPKCK